MGCEILQYETAGDDRDKIADKISEVLKEADLILTTGGVSVGDKDLVPDVIESLFCRFPVIHLQWRHYLNY